MTKGEVLLARLLDAMGGALAVDGIRTMELSGKVSRKFPGAEEVDFPSAMWIEFPDRYRQEATLPVVKLVTVWTPSGAFTDMGDGPVALPDAQAASMEEGFRRNLVGLLQARSRPGFRALSGGTQGSAGPGAETLEIEAAGRSTTLVIESATGRVRQVRYRAAGAGGALAETVIDYSAYRAVGGLTYPFAFSATVAGIPTHSVELETVKVNEPIDPALFEPKGVPVPAEPVATPTPGSSPRS